MIDRRRPSINGLPLWAHVVSVVGFPIVVALILLGMFTGYLHSPMSDLAVLMKQHAGDDLARTKLLTAMCRHQAMALHLDVEDCRP